MKESVVIGMNLTGVHMSPQLTREMIEGNSKFPVPDSQGETTMDDLRLQYNQESGQLGTIPIPGTAKGVISTGMQKVLGRVPEVFIDKLGERLAFERTGARLYQAMITKCEALSPEMSTERLREIQSEEQRHFHLLRQAIEKIGADPTAQTPCADVTGVASMGFLQVITDPRTTIAQGAEMLLMAELIDGVSWEILIELAQETGMEDMIADFLGAKATEDMHLEYVRSWVEEMTLKNKTVQMQ